MDLFEPIPVHEWMADAACLRYHPDMWHPEGAGDDFATREAKRVCKQMCPVREQCLEHSFTLGNGAPEGIWGGLGQRSRMDMRVARNKEAAA